jgi:hypothetical protein
LRDAYDNDTTYGFQIIFPSGNGFKFLAEVRQHTWSSGTNGVVAATFSLRLKGKPVPIDSVLKLTTDLPSSLSVAVGAAISMAVVAAGGKPPYAYTWKKAGSTVSGQTSDTFNKATAVSGDAGLHLCGYGFFFSGQNGYLSCLHPYYQLMEMPGCPGMDKRCRKL